MVVTPITELVLTRSHSPCSKHRQGEQQAAHNFIPSLLLLTLMFGTSMRCRKRDGNFPYVLKTSPQCSLPVEPQEQGSRLLFPATERRKFPHFFEAHTKRKIIYHLGSPIFFSCIPGNLNAFSCLSSGASGCTEPPEQRHLRLCESPSSCLVCNNNNNKPKQTNKQHKKPPKTLENVFMGVGGKLEEKREASD